MVRSHTVMVWSHYLREKSLLVGGGGGGEWQTKFNVSPGPGLCSTLLTFQFFHALMDISNVVFNCKLFVCCIAASLTVKTIFVVYRYMLTRKMFPYFSLVSKVRRPRIYQLGKFQ